MNRPHDLLAAVADGVDPGPFALVRREGVDHVDLFTGPVGVADRLADLPLPEGGPGPRTLALVPYRQIAERGFECVDDGVPLEYLTVTGHVELPLADLLAALPAGPVVTDGAAFDVDDDEYARIVERVLAEEIGRGEGANFVIHRTLHATVQGAPLGAALAALGRLLRDERGAYWTFLVHTGTRTLVGASPERHVSVDDGLVMMNPISGTFRHTGTAADRDGLLRFLRDPKEVEELYMVLDEELKMMAGVAEHGGQVVGPYLKEMAHLAHTEYLLAGRGTRDVREVLRETMFAPTVTGSPMQNACRVIARHERTGRRYYSGVLALLGRDAEGRQTLDAPILIRTAEISPPGSCGCRSGRPWSGTPPPPARSPRRTPRPPGCSPRWGSGRRRRPSARTRRCGWPTIRRYGRCSPPATPRWPGSGSTSGPPAPRRCPGRSAGGRWWSTARTPSPGCSPTSCARWA